MENYDSEMRDYYRDRAPVYDRVYSCPERQSDLRQLETMIPNELARLDVIEVAAGTGYWTQFIHKTVLSILATDATSEALERAYLRPGLESIKTIVVDAYKLEVGSKLFSGAFAGLWLSHVPSQRLDEFFSSLHRCLVPGAKVVLIDNSVAQCKRLPISHKDSHGNTYQDRVLDDGSVHRVMKNFPNKEQLDLATESHGTDAKHQDMEHFWFYSYVYGGG